MDFLDGFVTALLLGLYGGEMFFQWRPLYKFGKPYGSRTATRIAIAKYGISFLAFIVPQFNVTKVAAIMLTSIGFIKEVGYLYKLQQIKKRRHITI